MNAVREGLKMRHWNKLQQNSEPSLESEPDSNDDENNALSVGPFVSLK